MRLGRLGASGRGTIDGPGTRGETGNPWGPSLGSGALLKYDCISDSFQPKTGSNSPGSLPKQDAFSGAKVSGCAAKPRIFLTHWEHSSLTLPPGGVQRVSGTPVLSLRE